MPIAALPAIIGAAGAIGGGLLSKNKQQSTTNQSSSTTPTLTPEYQPLQSLLIKQATDRLNGGGLPSGFIENGIQGINRNSNIGDMALNNSLTARGLSTSPIAGNALLQSGIARQGQLNNFENVQAPMVQDQLQRQNLDFAGNLLQMGRGTSSTGTATTTGTTSVNPFGSALSSGSELLAYLYGKGAFGGGAQSPAVNTGAPTSSS